MENQYLVVAESIIYKNSKLTCINIFDQFVSVQLPAEFHFDLAVMCGPGWESGEYSVAIKAQTTEETPVQIGEIKVNIPNENFVYNALAPNLRVSIGADVKKIKFLVFKNDKIIVERSYPVNSLMGQKQKEKTSLQ